MSFDLSASPANPVIYSITFIVLNFWMPIFHPKAITAVKISLF